MKKLLIVLAAGIAAIGLVSCGSAPKTSTTTQPSAPKTTETETPAEKEDTVETTESQELIVEPITEENTEVPEELPEETVQEEYVYVPYTPTGTLSLVDDFEDGLFWQAIEDSFNDGDCSSDIDISEEWYTNGPSSLKCVYKSAGSNKYEKSGFLCEGASLLDSDWHGAKMILFDVNNPNDYDIDIMIVTQAGENWEAWNQTNAFKCKAGTVTPVYFDLSTQQHLEIVNRVIIYLSGDAPADGYFLVDNIQIEY